jgi:1,4-alpha-glucan branching enzyme
MRVSSLSLLLPVVFLMAQNGASWTPNPVVKGDTLTITFDAKLNVDPNEGLTDASVMTLHWGVNQSAPGNWQIPPQSIWPEGTVQSGSGAVRSPMVLLRADVWQVRIIPDNTINSLHFVVNNGAPASTGPNWGHSTGGNDWDLTIFDKTITAVILEPSPKRDFGHPARNPHILNNDDVLSLSTSAVLGDAPLDSLFIYLSGRLLAASNRDTLNYDLRYTDLIDGFNEVSVVARDEAASTDMTSLIVFKSPLPENASLPADAKPGITYHPGGSVTLAIFAPNKKDAYLIGDFNSWKVDADYQMKQYTPTADSLLFWLTLDNLQAGDEYAFQYYIDGEIRVADPYSHKYLDEGNDPFIPASVYPNLKPYPSGLTEHMVSLIEVDRPVFAWQYSDDFQRPDPDGLVIYELLLRDFLAESSYEMLIDTLDYLEDLGVNAIELMPINEFDGNSSWGYNPAFFFAVDKYYGTEEAFKRFVDECHRRGIAVILDVVLNHATSQNTMVRLYNDGDYGLPGTDNLWYNREAKHDFNVFNDMNHESVHSQYIVDRHNRFWLEEFRIDGYRFDLTKGFMQTGSFYNYNSSRIAILKRMYDAIRAVDTSAYVIFEHLGPNDEEKELANYGIMLWGKMTEKYNEATMGYHEGNKSDLAWIYHGTRGWNDPHIVGYMESHDEERLMYKNLRWGNSDGDYQVTDLATALDRQKAAAGFFLTIPGPKMIWQFGELGYDVSLFANEQGEVPEPYGDDTYKLDRKPIRWNYLRELNRQKLYLVFSNLARLRHEQPVFTSGASEVVLEVGKELKRVGLHLDGTEVVIIGNFGLQRAAMNPKFPRSGRWYDFFPGDSIEVTDVSAPIDLKPGEFHIYSNVKFFTPDTNLVTNIVTDGDDLLPFAYALGNAYPNPFNPSTTIPFVIARPGRVEMIIYDISGRQVRKLVNSDHAAGSYRATWDGRNDFNREVASGIYFLRFRSGDFQQTRKLIMLK